MEIKQLTVVCFGDLYRFYVDGDGEIIAVHFFPFMGTQSQTVEYDDLPQDVKDKFEAKYVS